MNVSSVTNTTYTSNTQQTKTSNTGYSFTQIMEQMRNQQTAGSAASSTAAARAADVRAGLDAETLAQLDKYTEIYNKYAAKYGDGFEIVKTICGSASDVDNKLIEARAAFYSELGEAGILGTGTLVKAGEVDESSITFVRNVDEYFKTKYNTDISALFYAEKYGVAGLSKDEQCKAILGGLKTSSAEDMAVAAQMLYNVGAISAYESKGISMQTSLYAGQSLGPNATTADVIAAQRDAKYDWGVILDIFKGDGDGNGIYELLSKAWETEDDKEGEKLKAIMKKVDAQQDSIHEAIELSNQKRRERDLLDRAAAEGARLRIMFGLDNGLDINAADMVQDTAEILLSVQ